MRNIKTFNMFFFLVFLVFIVLPNPSMMAQEPKFPNSIFLLAGQSNMAGRGVIMPGQATPSSPNILQLGLNHTWFEAHEPLHKEIDEGKRCGIGPGMSFAKTVLAMEPNMGVIGLVPCARGGTGLKQWARGSKLYDNLVQRAYASTKFGGKIKGLLWFQGETDTNSTEDALLYETRLPKFFNDLRDDLHLPDLPIVQVALASGYHFDLITTVRQAQLFLCLKKVRTVDAWGLPLGLDGLHLNTDGAVRLGQMLAHTFLSLKPKHKWVGGRKFGYQISYSTTKYFIDKNS
uniref:Sialate O-acetylesterase domain-containing protein n=1 Tax=Quercus lobata TaxID=97700 RepID=A0A7N2KRL0_QUELO